jgi:hypothetical protein
MGITNIATFSLDATTVRARIGQMSEFGHVNTSKSPPISRELDSCQSIGRDKNLRILIMVVDAHTVTWACRGKGFLGLISGRLFHVAQH